jgi:hypothetical protein
MLHRPLSVLHLHDQCLSVGYVAAAATFPLSNFILLNMHLMATRTPFLKRALNSLELSVDVVNPGLSITTASHVMIENLSLCGL